MHAGAILILVLALETAADHAYSDQNATADLALSILFSMRYRDPFSKISAETEKALLQMQAVPRLCKLLASYIAAWTSKVPFDTSDHLTLVPLKAASKLAPGSNCIVLHYAILQCTSCDETCQTRLIALFKVCFMAVLPTRLVQRHSTTIQYQHHINNMVNILTFTQCICFLA